MTRKKGLEKKEKEKIDQEEKTEGEKNLTIEQVGKENSLKIKKTRKMLGKYQKLINMKRFKSIELTLSQKASFRTSNEKNRGIRDISKKKN